MDRDNDIYSGHCSVRYGNFGWWFSKCMGANLNGFNYAANASNSGGFGIYWYSFKKDVRSLKTVTMSILPKNSQLIAGDLKTIPATCKPYHIGKIQNADCYGVYKTGLPLPGIYDIGNPARSVRCLENGWTTIQHRGQYGNPKDYFAKPWAEYVEGFGTSGRHLNIFIYFFIENKNINEGHLSSQSALDAVGLWQIILPMPNLERAY